MKDIDKLKQIYKILNKALRDIEDVSILDDYILDKKIDEVFNAIDDAYTEVYWLIKGIEKINNEKNI